MIICLCTALFYFIIGLIFVMNVRNMLQNSQKMCILALTLKLKVLEHLLFLRTEKNKILNILSGD